MQQKVLTFMHSILVIITAVEEKVASETLSKVLYPNDGTDEGRRLRLKQQHFFVSCSLQDMLRSLEKRSIPITEFPNTGQFN